MSKKTPITKNSLKEYGFVTDDCPIYPMAKSMVAPEFQEKMIDEYGDGAFFGLVVTTERNVHELALTMPNGTKLFLHVQYIEDLKEFEKCVQSFDDNP